jgi:hypothetical protein
LAASSLRNFCCASDTGPGSPAEAPRKAKQARMDA